LNRLRKVYLPQLPNPARPLPIRPGPFVLFALAYFLAATLGQMLQPQAALGPVVWPAAGVALGTLLLLRKRDWPLLLLAEFIADVAASLISSQSFPHGLAFGLVNCLQTLTLAWLLSRTVGLPIYLNNLKQVLFFCALLLVTCYVTALGGALAATTLEQQSFYEAWFLWSMSTSIGTLLVAPVMLTFAGRKTTPRGPSRLAWMETVLFVATLLVFCAYAFLNAASGDRFLILLPYFIFPLIFWAALRFGPNGAANATLILSIFAISGTIFNLGPFAAAGQATQGQVLLMQVFLAIAALSGAMAAAIIAERQEAEYAMRNSEERLRATMTNSPVIITQLNRQGGIPQQPPASGRTVASAALPASQFLDRMTAESQQALEDTLEKTFQSGEPQRVEIAMEEDTGDLRWYDVRFGPIEVDGVVTSVTMSAMDITQLKEAEAALRTSEERYTLAARGANDGIWDWDLLTDRVYYSPRWKSLLGYPEEKIKDSPDEWLGRIHPEDLAQVRQDLNTHLQGSTPHFVSEHRVMHRSGSYRWFLVRGMAVHGEHSKARRLAGSMTDITSRKLTEERLLHDAMHDTLTGLANRFYFSNQLQRSLDLAKRHSDYIAAVLQIDLDRFKIVNDSLGHALGDQMLVAFGHRLEASVRPEDTVARLGGDEFGILLEEINSINEATRVANRIQANLAAPFDLQGHEVFATISAGINLVAPTYEKAADLLRDAELAMYQAKANGRSRYQIFDKEMHARSMAQFRMEAELRWALERLEFKVYYQPIYHSISGEITCCEALLRWEHPERGLLLPGEFIPLAEETGLIVPIGEWVLRTVCRQMAAWLAVGVQDLRVAVNISARQLQDPAFSDLVARMLAETGVPGQALQLEITESAAMQDFELTLQALETLIQLGIKISLDDFGMRYSSLDYLKRFPVNTIKIDKSFVLDIPQDLDDSAITCAIISVGHILNLKVVAEGVETRQQLEFLLTNKCDELQGHFYSRALTSEAAFELLREKKTITPS
jgi:diguanylate cyclase (GGDEF)-like protein/PAS domain S-box-containing protein